jgi:hypothetical protein
MYEIPMPTWIASGPGGDWHTAMPSRIHLLGEPRLLPHQFALHLSHERDWAAKAEEPSRK